MAEIVDIPQGYKKTKLGIIPDSWKVQRLEDTCSHFKSGIGITSKNIFETGDIPVYGGNGLRGYTNRYSHEGEYVLIGRQGALCGNIQFVKGKSYISEHAIAVQANEQNVLAYLRYKLEQERLNRYSESSAQPGLSVAKLLKLKVALPPLPEQQKIAEILSTWDQIISTTQKLIDELKLRNKGLAQQLLTGKKRLSGFEGEWKELRADKIFKNYTNKSHNGELEVLSATQERGVIPRSMNNIDIKFDEGSLGNYKKVEIGDYVISLRSFQGGLEYSEYEGIVSPAYTVLKEIAPISKTFFKIYFKTETFISRLNTIIYGIRDGKQINYKDFSTLKLPYPPIAEQNAIAVVLEQADKELKLYQKQLDTLKEQKKGLMQKLLTGEVRVKIN